MPNAAHVLHGVVRLGGVALGGSALIDQHLGAIAHAVPYKEVPLAERAGVAVAEDGTGAAHVGGDAVAQHPRGLGVGVGQNGLGPEVPIPPGPERSSLPRDALDPTLDPRRRGVPLPGRDAHG